MAWTATDLENLRKSYALGALRVKTGDKDVTYRSRAEMAAVIAEIESALYGRDPQRMSLCDYDGGRS